MNKKTLLVLGTFWIIVALVSASSVSADGLYWGDSVDEQPVGPTANLTDLLFDKPAAEKNPFLGDNIVTICSGMYWGD